MAKGLLFFEILFVISCTGVVARDVQYIQAISNPHAEESSDVCKAGDECPLVGAIDLTNVLSAPIPTQSDTFMGIVHKRFQGIEVPIYHFKQPDRLNPKQLPFKIVRMKSIDLNGIVHLSVDPNSASDSWFPGYSWDVIVCARCGEDIHLGWRFTNSFGESFYALIVEYADAGRRDGERSVEAEEILRVGSRAPAWLATFAASTLAARWKT